VILAELLVKLTGDTKSLDGALDRTNKGLDKVDKSANKSKGAFGGLFKAMMPAIGFGAVTAAVGSMLKAFADSEKTVAQLTNQLSVMKGATKETVNQFQNIASSIQQKM
jgi:hypothetical protein